MVIFGASGDLTARKLVPALYAANCQGLFPGRLQLIESHGDRSSPRRDRKVANRTNGHAFR